MWMIIYIWQDLVLNYDQGLIFHKNQINYNFPAFLKNNYLHQLSIIYVLLYGLNTSYSVAKTLNWMHFTIILNWWKHHTLLQVWRAILIPFKKYFETSVWLIDRILTSSNTQSVKELGSKDILKVTILTILKKLMSHLRIQFSVISRTCAYISTDFYLFTPRCQYICISLHTQKTRYHLLAIR